MRVLSDSPARNGGYIHGCGGLDEKTVRTLSRTNTPKIDAVKAFAEIAATDNRYRFDILADEAGLSVASLRSIGAVYSGLHRCLAFPMFCGDGKIIGVRMRYRWGRKLGLLGTGVGLFVPDQIDPFAPLFIVEGMTDTAAALDMGLQAIGRPSCLGQTALVKDWISGHLGPVWIVADNDKGGHGLAGAIRLRADLETMTGARLKVIVPPRKDFRSWLHTGATTRTVLNWASQSKDR